MRDLGLDFYRQDKYAKNLFAQYFSLEDLPPEDRKFELVTCFEVFEHLSDPIAEFDRMFALGESVLCSTSLQSTNIAVDLASWDYLGALHGQHISFYTEDSMLRIAEKYGKKYYSNGVDLHLFTPNEISNFQMVSLTTRLKNKAHKLVDTVFSVIEAPGPKSRELKSLINDDSKRVSEIVSQQQKKH